MVCLGLEPGWQDVKAQTNPLSHGGTPEGQSLLCCLILYSHLYVSIPYILKGKNAKKREPRSNGYGRRLVFRRLWVRISAQYAGWTLFTDIS